MKIVDDELRKLFKDMAQQKYNSATFGKCFTKAEKIIHNTTYKQDQWEIVPSDIFKPLQIDKHMHKLVHVFETEDNVKARCIDPKVLKEEVWKPEIESTYNDFIMSVDEA